MTPSLVVTQGDPSGIGPELALAAWTLSRSDPSIPPFAVLADPNHLRRVAQRLGWAVPMAESAPRGATADFTRALPILPLSARVRGEPGRPHADDAPATIESIERAVALTRAGSASAVVTNPIAKHVLRQAGFPHPGHTEFLAALTRTGGAEPVRAAMMLWCDALAVTPVTIHVPLADAPKLLTRNLIVETARIVARALSGRVGIASPRLVACGLNPHAGENGTMGREEIDVIAPALAALRTEGIDIRGPLPADTMFHAAARASYDAALCMTHDQALIPIKTIAFESAVNVTLGLPFVRTSPDHGTAFDIAGCGVADPSSFVAALRLAHRLARRP